MKKLILVAAIAAATSSAFAMEALDESVLSETTGQAGITIEQGNFALSIAALRYLDTDGWTAAQQTAAGNPTATSTYGTASTAGNGAGALKISNLTLSATRIVTNIDVGSNGNLAASRTGIIVDNVISGLTFDLGGISLHNSTATGASAIADGTNAGSNGSLGGIKLANLSLGSGGTAMLITPKQSASGIVIDSLKALNVSFDFNYYDTDVVGSNVSGAAGNITAPVAIKTAVNQVGQIEVNVVGGANAGLQLTTGNTTIDSIELGSNGATPSAITIGTTTLGRIGISDLRIGGSISGGVATGSSTMTVRGH